METRRYIRVEEFGFEGSPDIPDGGGEREVLQNREGNAIHEEGHQTQLQLLLVHSQGLNVPNGGLLVNPLQCELELIILQAGEALS